MGDGYVKIYGDRIRNSSLWLESKETRLVFVEMLAIADRCGWVNTPSVRVLANALNLTVEDTESALAVLEAPDLESRTPEEDGRRLIRSQGGWQIVNYEHYREFRTEKQEQDRRRAKEKRVAEKTQKKQQQLSVEKRDGERRIADVGDESQSQRLIAPPAAADASEISQTRATAPGHESAWTASAQRTAFVAAFEQSQRTTPGMGGKSVATFHAEVLRSAELQGRQPDEMFRAALAKWLGKALNEQERKFPYACFQAAWGDLTAAGRGGQGGGSPRSSANYGGQI